jgi:hypothetical protein
MGGVAWSEGNNGGWRRPRVVVGRSCYAEVVLGSAVLRVWSNRSKRGWSRLSAAARVELGGAVVMGQRGCQGQSWKGRKGAPARGGARGGDGWAEGWPEEAALNGLGCGGRCRHDARRKQRRGVSGSRGRGQGSSGCYLKAACMVWMRSARGSDRDADTRGPHGFLIIPELCKRPQL